MVSGLFGNGEMTTTRTSAGPSARQVRDAVDNEAALQLIEDRGPSARGASGMFAFVAAGADGRSAAARDPVDASRDRARGMVGQVRIGDEAFEPEWLLSWRCSRGLTHGPTSAWSARACRPRCYVSHCAAAARPASVLADMRRADPRGRAQMMGDVPAGVFLSGGLVVAWSRLSRPLALRTRRAAETFAVGTPGSRSLPPGARRGTWRLTITAALHGQDVLISVAEAVRATQHSMRRSCGALCQTTAGQGGVAHVKVVPTGEGVIRSSRGTRPARDRGPDEVDAEVDADDPRPAEP